ncbi:MAG TPA: hypothetical protein VEL07_15060 [Planctomycetota bacterium]|nr:hypothetical protein [Planctomycetota bacterium]
MPIRAFASATLLALVGGAASGAELLGGFVDMRLSGGISGGAADVHYSDNQGPAAERANTTNDEGFDTNYRIKVDWVGSLGLRSYGGWIWGVGLTYNYRTDLELDYRDEGVEVPGGNNIDGIANPTPLVTDAPVDFHAWSANGFIGYAVPFGEHFQLEFLPFVGVGRAYMETPESQGHLNRAADAYTEAGLNVNAVWTLRNGFQFGASVGYWWWETSITHDAIEEGLRADPRELTGSSAKFKFESWDYQALLFIGIRL